MTDTSQEVRETPEAHSIPCDVHSYAQEYEFRFDDGGGYTPSDAERSMIEDAIHGYLSEVASAPPPAVPDAVGVREAMDRYNAVWQGWPEAIDAGNVEAVREAAMTAALSSIEPTPSPEPQADAKEEFEQEDTEITWRDLALQFDGQRILALQLLRAMVDEPGKWQDRAAEFVKAPPLSGEAVLAERIAALSPEPQASNAGAVEVNYDDFFAAYRYVPRSKMSPTSCLKTRLRSLLREEDLQHADEAEEIQAQDSAALTTPEPQTGERDDEVERLRSALVVAKRSILEDTTGAVACVIWVPQDVCPAETLVDHIDAALSTPEPQTGERDKAIHDIAEAIGLGRNMCDDDGGGSTDLDVFRQAFFALDAVEQMLLAERTAREAAEREARAERNKREIDCLDMQYAAEGWEEAAKREKARAEASERRLAEVEERARKMQAALERIRSYPAEDRNWCRTAINMRLIAQNVLAALRAKPEAQAIVGKEAQS